MGLPSFSIPLSPEQSAQEIVHGMKAEYKEALFNELLSDVVKGSVWGLLDGKYHEYLEETDKQEIADPCIDEFVNEFNRPGSSIWESYKEEVNKIVSKKVKETVVKKTRS